MLPKITTALLLLGAIGFESQAQLTVQSGASFYMQSGSLVTVQGDVQNAGTINNDGNLKVQGNYTNTGTYTGVGSAGVLEMYGIGNSNITPGSSAIANLTINKSAASDVVTLTASTTVNNGFTLTQGILTTNPTVTPAVALISPAATPYTFAAGKEVIGKVRRTGWSAGTSRVFNQPNMQVSTAGGTTPTDITVNMIPNGDPTQTEREVKRVFNFEQTGGSGFTADVRYPYLSSELNTNTEGNLVPWRLVSSEWNARLTPVTRDGANDWVSTTGIAATDLIQEWKLADPNYTMNVMANLRGPWNGTTMNTNINSILPLNQPYNVSPYNYTGTETAISIPATAVDWVLVEHRKPASGLPADALVATITGRKAGFLLSNGTVVEVDGVTPISVPITKQGNAFIAIRHRNHLGVLSNVIASNITGSFANDYTILANSYKPVGAPSDPVVLLSGGGGKYGLWAGDANKNGAVNATDVNAIKSAIAGSTTGYQFTDANMSNSINATDVTITKSTISLSGAGSGTNLRTAANGTSLNTKAVTNLPDPIIEN